MSEYSIHVLNGKVVGDSTFFLLANTSLGKECKRLCEFTDELDKSPLHKKERIAEYKCAKYRYAAVSTVHSLLQINNNGRKEHNIEYTNFVLLAFYERIKDNSEYLSQYEAASASEKPDFSLYYALLTVIDNELAELEEKLTFATDWERVELEERIGGWKFAKECLNEAWKRRKEVTA